MLSNSSTRTSKKCSIVTDGRPSLISSSWLVFINFINLSNSSWFECLSGNLKQAEPKARKKQFPSGLVRRYES